MRNPKDTMAENFAGVRMARPEDEESVYALLMQLHAENGLSPVSEQKTRAMIRRATQKDGGIIGLIEGKDGIEASVGLLLTQWWYSEAWHLEEMWTFVHPDHRRTTHAKRLIEFAKWASDRMGVPLLMGILTRDRLAPKLRLYQRQIPQVGALFVHGALPADAFNQRRLVEIKHV